MIIRLTGRSNDHYILNPEYIEFDKDVGRVWIEKGENVFEFDITDYSKEMSLHIIEKIIHIEEKRCTEFSIKKIRVFNKNDNFDRYEDTIYVDVNKEKI